MVRKVEGSGSPPVNGNIPSPNTKLTSIAQRTGQAACPGGESVLPKEPGIANSKNKPTPIEKGQVRNGGKSPQRLGAESGKINAVTKLPLANIARQFGRDGIPFNQK